MRILTKRIMLLVRAALAMLCFSATACTAQIPFAAVQGLGPENGLFLKPGQGKTVSDIFIGQNSPGPFALTWRNIDSGSELVQIAGKAQLPGADYIIDPPNGTMRFTRPLPKGVLARVDYTYSPGFATLNASTSPLPIDLHLAGSSQGGLVLHAVYLPSPGGLSAGTSTGVPGTMALGLSGSAGVAGGSIISSSISVDSRGGNVVDRSQFSIRDVTHLGGGQVAAEFIRTGVGFAMPGATPAGGQQILTASAALKPIGSFAAGADFSQTTSLNPADKGKQTTILGEHTAGTLGRLAIDASHTDTSSSSATGLLTQQSSDALSATRKLSGFLTAGVSVQRTDNRTVGSAAVAQTTALLLHAQPGKGLEIVETVQNQLTATGGDDSSQLQITATPGRTVKVTAGAQDNPDPKAPTHARTAEIQITPSTALTVTGDFQQNQVADLHTQTGSLAATANPTTFLQVNGGFALRDAQKSGTPVPGTLDTYNVGMALDVDRKRLQLTGAWANNPAPAQGPAAHLTRSAVGVKSDIGLLTFGGDYGVDQAALPAHNASVMMLRVGLHLGTQTSLATSFREALSQTTVALADDTYTISLTHRVGNMLDLSLGGVMTTHAKEGLQQPLQDYSAQAHLAIHF